MSASIPFFEGSSNLSFTERAVSVALGLGLAAAATKPRPNPLLNVAALIGGGYLALRGASGRCPIKQALVQHNQLADRSGAQRSQARVRRAA
jgi:hypothetical protein